MFTIPPKNEWHEFMSDDEALAYAKEIGIIPQTNKMLHPFIFVDKGEIHRCTLAGYEDDWTTVVLVENELCCVHPDYLREMQEERNNRFIKLNDCDILNAPAYVALDFETTGFDCYNDSIIEIGAAKIENGKETAVFSTLVNPHQALSPQIQKLTGINEIDLWEAPDLEDIEQDFITFIGELPLVAHNAAFDMRVLFNNFLELLPSKIAYFDTLKYARDNVTKVKDCKLDTLIKHYGLHCQNTHRALDDARCIPQLIAAISGKHGQKTEKAETETTESSTEELLVFEKLKKIVDEESKKRWMPADLAYLRPAAGYSSICYGGDDKILARLKIRKKSCWIAFPQNAKAPIPEGLRADEVIMDGFIRFSFSVWDNRLTELFINSIHAYFENYITVFSCCSSYAKCSEARRCLHPNDMFYLSCSYRKKLYNGVIFYGENKTQ